MDYRNYKFRALSIVTGGWVYWHVTGQMPVGVRKQTIGMWTTRYDKNGKEIYQDDIVSGWLPGIEKDEEFDEMKVMYDGAAFALFRTDNPKKANENLYFGDLEPCTDNKSIEVIGNTHENNEILNQ